MLSGDEALVFHFGIVAEVYEQPEFTAGGAKIVQKLRAVLIDQCRNGFDFDNDPIVADEIGGERLNESTVAISQGLRRLRQERHALRFKFNFQALVVNGFEKAAAFLFVNGKTRADDGVALVFVKQPSLSFVSCHSRVSWVKTSGWRCLRHGWFAGRDRALR